MGKAFMIPSLCVSLTLLTGCMVGLQAESKSMPPIAQPSTPQTIRVRILMTRSASGLTAAGGYQFQLKKGGKVYAKTGVTRVHASGGTMVFGSAKLKGAVTAIPSDAVQFLTLNGRRYRGMLVFYPLGGGRYEVVEHVDLDEYLYGVLPREVGKDWPQDSLKAQAIISRTYALSRKAAAQGRADVVAGVIDQVYGGVNSEASEPNRAVQETRGEVLLDPEGNPAQTFFHSSCGGRTEVPERVWSSAKASDIFASITDPFCAEDPYYSWKLTISYATIRSRLHRAGVNIKPIKKIAGVVKSESGRAEFFELQTARGIVRVPGNKFRLALGPEVLRSTLLTTMNAGKSNVTFEGRGWGHGVGLCQWGARGRALAGQNYKTILLAYYPKAKLAKI